MNGKQTFVPFPATVVVVCSRLLRCTGVLTAGLCAADGPAPNPQALLNSLGSVVTAASSVASAQQAVTSAASGSGSGNVLQAAGDTAQALEVSLHPPHEYRQS